MISFAKKCTCMLKKTTYVAVSFFLIFSFLIPRQLLALDVTSGDGILLYGDSKRLNSGLFYPASLKVWKNGAPTNGDALLFYGDRSTTPQYKDYSYTNNTFGGDNDTQSENTPVTVKMETNPTKEEAITGYVNSSGTLQILCYDGSSWSEEWSATVGGAGGSTRFDIAFERNSGDALITYSTNTGTTNELAYRTKAGSDSCGSGNWSSESTFDPVRTSGVVQWVEMASDYRSAQNIIGAIWADTNSDLSGAIWNGSAWVNEPAAVMNAALEVVSTAQDVKSFDIDFEASTGDVMVTYGSGGTATTNGAFYRACPIGGSGNASDCTWGAQTAITSMADDATNLDISSDPNTDDIVFASIGNAGSDMQAAYWSGTAWTGSANVDITSATPVAGSQMISTGWLKASSTTRSIVTYHDASSAGVGFYSGNGGTFTLGTDFSPGAGFSLSQFTWEFEMDPHNTDRGLLMITDNSGDLWVKRVVMDSTPNFTWTNSDDSKSLVDYDSPTPKFRTYTNGSNSFGSETDTVAGTRGFWNKMQTSPIKQEAIAGYIDDLGTLQIMCYDGTSWTNDYSVSVGTGGTTAGGATSRRYDISYETTTGDAIVLYSTNTGTTDELAYVTKAGSSSCGSGNWSSASNLDPVRTSGVVHWVKMARDRRSSSDLITAIWADANSDLSAMQWSGSAWGNEPGSALETSLEVVSVAQDVEDFDVEYESNSGDVKVVWSNSAGTASITGVRDADCTGGTSTCTWSGVNTPATFANDATHLDLSANPDPATNGMIFASIGNGGSDLQIGYWSGTAWTNNNDVDTTAQTPLAHSKYVATGWLKAGGTTRAITTFYDSGATNIGSYSMATNGSFALISDYTTTPSLATQQYYDIQSDPFNTDRLIFTISNTSKDLFAKRLVMTSTPGFTWSESDGSSALETELSDLASYKTNAFSYSYWNFIPTPTYTQAAYRLYNNNDGTDVGSTLAVQDTAGTLASAGDAFRLRMLLRVGANYVAQSGQNFKLQFVGKGAGTCASPSGGTPSSYTDIDTTTVIAYNNNASPADGATLTPNANDPTDGGNAIVNQTYEELNNFTNSVASILSGQDGKWDFSLKDNSAPAGTTYCIRAVKSDGTPLDSYSVYPEIITASGTQSITFSISDNTIGFGTLDTSAVRYATGNLSGTTSEASAHTLSVNTNATNGYNLLLQGGTLVNQSNGSFNIDACGASCTPTANTEQFGLRVSASGGNGTVSSPYNHGSNYAWESVTNATDVVATSTSGDGVTTTYSAYYAGSVSNITGSGNYSTTLTYTAVPNY